MGEVNWANLRRDNALLPWMFNEDTQNVERSTFFAQFLDPERLQALTEEAEANGFTITTGEGDPCDVYIVEAKDVNELQPGEQLWADDKQQHIVEVIEDSDELWMEHWTKRLERYRGGTWLNGTRVQMTQGEVLDLLGFELLLDEVLNNG